ncbi:reverse transcriptase domain-containing protein [Trichonephila clavipes]|nr:reverse transcriptase domain-containing protein [Trichonephila clavipes]
MIFSEEENFLLDLTGHFQNLAECGLEFHRALSLCEHHPPSYPPPDTKITCYADDIAVWHSHNDITESEKALNTTLKSIDARAENLKLTINADKTNYCIFSTDRQHRSSFNANIKMQNSQIKKVDLPTYLGITLDPELRFSKHIEQTANKALGKLNILRKLSETSWGSRPQTLKSTFGTVIRPVLEYAIAIWTPASISVKRKLDSVQHRAAKIIIGAVSSTNNEKAVQECGLPLLESRCNLATIKFINKLRSYDFGEKFLTNGSILQGSNDLRLSNLILKSEKNSIWNIPPWSSFRSPSFQKTHQRTPVSNWNCCIHVPKKKTLQLSDKKDLKRYKYSLKITLQSTTLMVPQTDPSAMEVPE